MSSDTYCLCGQQYQPGQFMIECDCCREWFHGGCVNVKIFQSEDIDKYHCPKCMPTYGPSIFKVATNSHRQDRYEVNAEHKPTQTGSKAFITNLKSRSFPQHHAITMEGRAFTEAYLKEKGFNHPILFETINGLDLRVPPAATFDVRTVERHCGADREVDVIDVTRQNNFKMLLGDYVDYYLDTNKTKTLNVLSLEFSDTSMSGLVQPPQIARQLDWVRAVWPSSAPPFAPLVQKYCIMSSADSFTDFHIDFGGTTVWYHILHGEKVFYLIPPTPSNLALYQQWSMSNKQYEVFFGDLVDSCAMCTLKRGQTLFIPTGWIHAVFTPEDSLVFGGNFLHNFNIELQLQINEIEKQIETPTMFRFPLFETIHWYAGASLLQQLRRINEEQLDEDFTLEENKFEGNDKSSQVLTDLPPYLIRGIRVLLSTLKEWNACKSYDSSKKQNIPETVNSGQLVRDLSRELRRLEKLLTPPYSSHSANKKKKKKSRPPEMILHGINTMSRHFASFTKDQVILNNLNLPPSYDSHNSRNLYNNHASQQKKSLKLTLPKPIMHVPDSPHMFSNSSQDSEDAELSNIASIASRSGIASYSHNYDSQDSFGGEDYRIPGEHPAFDHKIKKANTHYNEHSTSERHPVSKVKSSEAPIRNPPPDYATTEHSILKSHLINSAAAIRNQKHSNHWTISKSHIKNNATDSADEQILFTNENLTIPGSSGNIGSYSNANVPFDGNGMMYGPGMYSSDGNQISQITNDNYNPDFIIDRKTAGLSLPDYSPTKSINEYLGSSKGVLVENTKQLQVPGNFANNSDPYSQPGRGQDCVSSFSDDSVLTNPEGFRIQEDTKDVTIVHNKKLSRYDSVESFDYIDTTDKTNEDYVIIDNVSNSMIKKIKNPHRQPYVGGHRGTLITNIDHLITYNTNSHCIIENVNPPPSYESSIAPRKNDRPARRRVDHRESIYDYEDQDDIDESDLYIDEAPKSTKKRRKTPSDKSSKSRNSSQIYNEDNVDGDANTRVPGGFAAPKNGIESLLQASAYTGPPGGDNQERDAVVGMLTIGQSYGLASSSRRSNITEGPPIRAVHKDDEYVYPSLEISSDDDDELLSLKSHSHSKRKRYPFVSPSGGKSDGEDESWWPHARLGRLVPRVNRPTRRGSRREAVQAALRAARLKGNIEQPHLPLSFPGRISPQTTSALDAMHNATINSLPLREPSTLSSMRRPHKKKRLLKPIRPMPVQHTLPSPSAVKNNTKFKKGMKTAKQRLGKILQIHKMMR